MPILPFDILHWIISFTGSQTDLYLLTLVCKDFNDFIKKVTKNFKIPLNKQRYIHAAFDGYYMFGQDWINAHYKNIGKYVISFDMLVIYNKKLNKVIFHNEIVILITLEFSYINNVMCIRSDILSETRTIVIQVYKNVNGLIKIELFRSDELAYLMLYNDVSNKLSEYIMVEYNYNDDQFSKKYLKLDNMDIMDNIKKDIYQTLSITEVDFQYLISLFIDEGNKFDISHNLTENARL